MLKLNKARIREEGIASLVSWLGDSTGFDKSASFFTGIPSRNTTSPVTRIMTQLGYGVIQPQYIGSYDSDGELLPENCVETIMKTCNYISPHHSINIQTAMPFQIRNNIEIAIGHCAGTCFLLEAILRGFSPKIAIFLSPMITFGQARHDAGIKVQFDKYVDYITHAFPITHRMNSDVWKHFFMSNDNFHTNPIKPTLSQKIKIFCITGKKDPDLDAVYCQIFTERFLYKYNDILELEDFIIVNDGTHSEESLFTSSLIQNMSFEFLKK